MSARRRRRASGWSPSTGSDSSPWSGPCAGAAGIARAASGARCRGLRGGSAGPAVGVRGPASGPCVDEALVDRASTSRRRTRGPSRGRGRAPPAARVARQERVEVRRRLGRDRRREARVAPQAEDEVSAVHVAGRGDARSPGREEVPVGRGVERPPGASSRRGPVTNRLPHTKSQWSGCSGDSRRQRGHVAVERFASPVRTSAERPVLAPSAQRAERVVDRSPARCPAAPKQRGATGADAGRACHVAHQVLAQLDQAVQALPDDEVVLLEQREGRRARGRCRCAPPPPGWPFRGRIPRGRARDTTSRTAAVRTPSPRSAGRLGRANAPEAPAADEAPGQPLQHAVLMPETPVGATAARRWPDRSGPAGCAASRTAACR